MKMTLKNRVGLLTFIENFNRRPEGQEGREKLERLVEEGEGRAEVVRGGFDDREGEQVHSNDRQEHGRLRGIYTLYIYIHIYIYRIYMYIYIYI